MTWTGCRETQSIVSILTTRLTRETGRKIHCLDAINTNVGSWSWIRSCNPESFGFWILISHSAGICSSCTNNHSSNQQKNLCVSKQFGICCLVFRVRFCWRYTCCCCWCFVFHLSVLGFVFLFFEKKKTKKKSNFSWPQEKKMQVFFIEFIGDEADVFFVVCLGGGGTHVGWKFKSVVFWKKPSVTKKKEKRVVSEVGMIVIVPLWIWFICVTAFTTVIFMGLLHSCCQARSADFVSITNDSFQPLLRKNTRPSPTSEASQSTATSFSLFRSLLPKPPTRSDLHIQQEQKRQNLEHDGICQTQDEIPRLSSHSRLPNKFTVFSVQRRVLPFRPVRHGVTSHVSECSDEAVLVHKQVIVMCSSKNSFSMDMGKPWIIRLGSGGFERATQTFFVMVDEVWTESMCVSSGPLTLRLHTNGWCNEVEIQPNVLLSLYALSYSLDNTAHGQQKTTVLSVQLELVQLM